MQTVSNSVVAIIEHRVANYETWRKAFDAHVSARAQSGIVGEQVNRSIDDPDVVTLILQATSLEKLRSFLGSADLRGAMENAGVQGAPRITLARSA